MVVGEKEERQFLNLDDLDKKKRDLFTEKLESISKYNKAAADRIAEMED